MCGIVIDFLSAAVPSSPLLDGDVVLKILEKMHQCLILEM